MANLESFLHDLSDAVEHGATASQIEYWRCSPLLKEHELLQATYAVIAKRAGFEAPELHLEALPGGGVPLFGRGFLPWKSLPYPKEHAQLGVCLAQLGDLQTARKMARFQEATLDHTHRPAYALFTQEGSPCQTALDRANATFFETIGYVPSDTLKFSDQELGMISWRTPTSAVICLGSGCKSGLGVFLQHDAGIINWGPQTTPTGICEGFGLAGRAQKVQLNEMDHLFALSFQCRLAAPSTRETGFSYLRDGGFSAVWMEALIEGNHEALTCRIRFEALHAEKKPLLVLFGKGSSCLVAGSHLLKPRSLNRYGGPSQTVHLRGNLGNVCVATEGMAHMEIIPLAGDESFWGADFLIAYTLNNSEACLRLFTGQPQIQKTEIQHV